jgi:hypothetical protein
MISKEYIEKCPKCENTIGTCINQQFIITTSRFRKFIHAILIETLQCNECGETWTETYTFMHGHRGDWIFAEPILKCPICGGDNFEIERHERGRKDGQTLQFRCIENDDFVWSEEYVFDCSTIPD